jgi:ketosteroid isomerase-like protein
MHMTRWIGISIILIGCATSQEKSMEEYQWEVADMEKAFAEMAGKEGVGAAFLAFAVDDVVLLRGKRLIKGKAEMQDYFASGTLTDVKLSWEPTFIDVAAQGDMAYTYGPYTFSAKDTAGTLIEDTGYFHTVWKRQKDGQWKFVWD